MIVKLTQDTYENEDHLHFFCPICGLPNDTNTFFCTEVLEKMQQVAANYALAQIDAMLDKSFKGLNKSKFIKVTTKKTKPEPEKELYEPTKVYELVKTDCCGINVKTQNFDKEIGIEKIMCVHINNIIVFVKRFLFCIQTRGINVRTKNIHSVFYIFSSNVKKRNGFVHFFYINFISRF